MKKQITKNDSHVKYHFDNVYFANPKSCGNILLYQLGELYCLSNTDILEHKQSYYEFTYVLDGEGIVYCNEKSKAVKKYDCVWCKPSDTHRIVSSGTNPLRYAYAAYLSGLTEINVMHNKVFENKDDIILFSEKKLEQLFAEMLNTVDKDLPFANIALGNLLSLFIINSYLLVAGHKKIDYEINRNDISLLIYQISRYIDENILTIKSLKELEDIFHYNYQYLSKSFFKVMNITINDYFISRKMNKAIELMLNEKLNAAKTSEILGYSCPQAFSLAFKSRFGTSPNKYVKACLSNEQGAGSREQGAGSNEQ